MTDEELEQALAELSYNFTYIYLSLRDRVERGEVEKILNHSVWGGWITDVLYKDGDTQDIKLTRSEKTDDHCF